MNAAVHVFVPRVQFHVPSRKTRFPCRQVKMRSKSDKKAWKWPFTRESNRGHHAPRWGFYPLFCIDFYHPSPPCGHPQCTIHIGYPSWPSQVTPFWPFSGHPAYHLKVCIWHFTLRCHTVASAIRVVVMMLTYHSEVPSSGFSTFFGFFHFCAVFP